MRRVVTWVSPEEEVQKIFLNLKKRHTNAWVYLHTNIVNKLQKCKGIEKSVDPEGNVNLFHQYKERGKYWRIEIDYDMLSEWHRIEEISIVSNNNERKDRRKTDPEKLYFVKLED